MATLQEHESFEKLKRFREITVTEKPGFMQPEGVVVFDPQTGAKWKRTLEGDGHKGPKESPDA